MNGPKPTVIYVGDPMCSWCYGISEELSIAKAELGEKVDWQLIVGGLRPGGGDPWTPDFTTFLKHHWEEVHKASGQPFSYDILAADHFFYDTEPSCRSVVVVQSIDPSKQFDFFKEVQKKFYVGSEDPKQVSFYESICSDLGISFATFADRWGSDAYKVGTEQQFKEARALGVNSFPTILVSYKGQTTIVGTGFVKSEILVQSIREAFAD